MNEYGSYEREIKDFIEYWIPRFTDFNFYPIYPQSKEIIDSVISINFSIIPNEFLRLFYLIRGHDTADHVKLVEPKIDLDFMRKDYNVAEWGVLL